MHLFQSHPEWSWSASDTWAALRPAPPACQTLPEKFLCHFPPVIALLDCSKLRVSRCRKRQTDRQTELCAICSRAFFAVASNAKRTILPVGASASRPRHEIATAAVVKLLHARFAIRKGAISRPARKIEGTTLGVDLRSRRTFP